jgi:hypothetical protein
MSYSASSRAWWRVVPPVFITWTKKNRGKIGFGTAED